MITNMLVGQKPNTTVNMTQDEVATMAAFDNHLSRLGLGMHCAKCQGDLRGSNSVERSTFVVSCDCREFVAPNLSKI